MQACPYDALYIDPETHTAAKCNYCAHRIDVGLEPACVNVCPEHAIISGDMEDASTEIASLLARQPVKVRKPEKATIPNLFYIDADDSSLIPSATTSTTVSLWGSQTRGVGHFAKEAEKMAFSNTDVIEELVKLNGGYNTKDGPVKSPKTVEVLLDKTKQVYNTPDKGILWGWEVSGYVWTKAISAGAVLIPLLALILNKDLLGQISMTTASVIGLLFLVFTGLLLIKDLDQPTRFPYVLLRPHWGSWLVKGGYAITLFGALLTAIFAGDFFDLFPVSGVLLWITGIAAIVVAVYTAFLFAQAKGRDFWQSPSLAIHMLNHSVMAGAAIYLILGLFADNNQEWISFASKIAVVTLIINMAIMLIELTITHPTTDAKRVVQMITRGRYKMQFWIGVVLIGNILPLVLLSIGGAEQVLSIGTAILLLAGIYINNHIWVEAPQRISLS
jgi:formate-dependent nitrite reductase membrane component NrfD